MYGPATKSHIVSAAETGPAVEALALALAKHTGVNCSRPCLALSLISPPIKVLALSVPNEPGLPEIVKVIMGDGGPTKPV